MKYSVCYVGTLCVNDSTITVHDTGVVHLGNLLEVIGSSCSF